MSGQFLSDCSQPRPGDDSVLGYLFGVKRHYVWTERERHYCYNPCSDYNLKS